MLQKKRSNLGFLLNLVWGPPPPKLGPCYQVIVFIVLFYFILLQTSKFSSDNCGSPTIPRKIRTLSSNSVMVFDIRIWLFWWRGGRDNNIHIHFLKPSDHFKAIKRYLITGLALDPPSDAHPPYLQPKAQVWPFCFEAFPYHVWLFKTFSSFCKLFQTIWIFQTI